MKRLIKANPEPVIDTHEQLQQENDFDLHGAQVAVEELTSTVNDMFELYKKLFTNLNTLYSEYPKLYNEMKMIVRFPDDKDADAITRIKNDLEHLAEHYQDEGYLAEILDLYKGQKGDE